MIFSRSRRKRCRLSIEVVHTTTQIPTEIWEDIFSHLPVKSLLRLSSVSKSWNSIIHQPCFIKKYRGDETLILHGDSLSLSTIFSDNPTEEEASQFAFPFYPSDRPLNLNLKAIGDGIFCVQNFTDNSLFLWNPSLRSYRQLPNPLLPNWESRNVDFSYGLGYDVVGDDYKLLSISYGEERGVMLYSLRSDCWREIQSFPNSTKYISWSWFVRGTLHWLCKAMSVYYNVVVSFDLSSEEYGEVALPMTEYSFSIFDKVDLIVLRGELCLSLNYFEERRFVLWVMEDYGVVGSWTKKLDIDYSSISGFRNMHRLRPLYMCKDGKIVIFVSTFEGESGVILVNKNGESLVRRSFGRRRVNGGGLVFVESLVSPATWPS